jgi:hypothetical protein
LDAERKTTLKNNNTIVTRVSIVDFEMDKEGFSEVRNRVVFSIN